MVDNCTCWNLESIRIKKWFISVHIQILKIQGYLRRMVMTKILPETKLEPKLTKSVAFLLRADFQYTGTEKRKNRKTEKNKLVVKIYFHKHCNRKQSISFRFLVAKLLILQPKNSNKF